MPLAVDSFLGRETDLAGIQELFERNRLVTIAGAPGMGKTRLATELARASTGRHPGGTWLVPLAPLTNFELVAPTLASAFGVPDPSGADVVEALAARIGDAHLLLVLDNCEHLLDACAHLVAVLIESCPNLRVLATSQERLGVPGEQVWALRGLEVPAEATPGDPPLDAAEFPAVMLFAERARSADRDFVLSPDVVAPVVEICRRLDGIPLAIELAAGRVGTLSPAEIATLLDDRFALLTGGARTAHPRHQTLKAAVDWSYDLLTDEEQAMLRRLSVFAGGATIDAVERVCGGQPIEADHSLDLVTRLAARSLVVADKTSVGHALGGLHGAASPPRVSRYRLLETIRFYGRDRLREAGEASTTASRHLDWCIELAEEAEPHLTGPGQTQWLARLDADHDNLRAAIAHGLDQGPTDQAMRLAGALTLFWRIRGHFREGQEWLRRCVDVSGNAPTHLTAKAFWGSALMASMVGEALASARLARAALDLQVELGDRVGGARSYLVLGTYPRAGDQSETINDLQQSIALARQADDKWCLAYALAVCGTTFSGAGERIARRMLEEAVAVASDLGDPECLRYARISLARVLIVDGELGDAQQVLEGVGAEGPGLNPYEQMTVRMSLARIAVARADLDQAQQLLDLLANDVARSPSAGLRIDWLCLQGQFHVAVGNLEAAEASFWQARRTGESLDIHAIRATLGLGEIALARGDHAGAGQLFDEVREAPGSADDRRVISDVLQGLAGVALAAGDDRRASDVAQRAVALRMEVGDRTGLADSLELLACADARLGRAAKAVRLFAAVDADRGAGGYVAGPQSAARGEAAMAAARSSLGDEAFADAWTQGSATTLQEAATASPTRRGRPRGDRPARGPDSLTESELAVARLVLEGLSNQEVAARLFLSLYTVKTHVSRVYAKVGVASRRELRDRFREQGL